MAWQHMAHTGPPRSPAFRRDPPPPERRRVHGPPQWMRTGCSCAECLRDPMRGSHGQELHEALKEAHVTIGEEADERVRLREEIPAIDAQAAADFNDERARLAEWDADQLRGQIGPATTSLG